MYLPSISINSFCSVSSHIADGNMCLIPFRNTLLSPMPVLCWMLVLRGIMLTMVTANNTPFLQRTWTKTLNFATISNPILSVWAKSLMVSCKQMVAVKEVVFTSQHSVQQASVCNIDNSSTSGRTNLVIYDSSPPA